MPDEELLTAAADGTLTSDVVLSAQIDRMLKSERFAASIERFHSDWLSLNTAPSKDTNLFPEYSPAFAAAARDEMRRFFRSVLLKGDGRWETLLTSTTSEVNADLADIYGVKFTAGPDGFGPVSLDVQSRAGFLTRVGFLTINSNPSRTNPPRVGDVLWQHLLCRKSVGAPPQGATESFRYSEGLTVRQNFVTLEAAPACVGCHASINAIGFSFENYDALGRFRLKDRDFVLDASGGFTSATGPQSFKNIIDLSKTFATDPDATSCVAKQWFRFASRRLENMQDAASLEGAFGKFKGASFDIRVFLKSLIMSRTFRSRGIEAGEVTQ
jgi:Protein of unknown function (DUF1592)/Protein of unknown function (DUF1588)/Protein of unknown function (DUF1585)